MTIGTIVGLLLTEFYCKLYWQRYATTDRLFVTLGAIFNWSDIAHILLFKYTAT